MATDPADAARAAIMESIEAQQKLLDGDSISSMTRAAGVIVGSIAAGGKLLLFGNGGSASDASHIAAEFVGRFTGERRALPALSLCANDSALTAIGNDYGFDRVFARQLEGLGRPGDVAFAISTSGRSANVLAGARAARDLGMATIGLTGADGGELKPLVDVCLCAPASRTARVQESHILIAHVLCALVELELK